MKKRFCLFICIFYFVLPANGFKKFFGKKVEKHSNPKILLRDSFLIEKNIVLDKELYSLRIGYMILPALDEIMVSAVYDELIQIPIIDIDWQIQNSKTPKKPIQTFKAYKTQENILKQMEEMAQALDPNQAYDRIITSKHLVKKDFFFKKSEIFNTSKPLEEQKQFLEICFAKAETNPKFILDISEQIYFKNLPNIEKKNKSNSAQTKTQQLNKSQFPQEQNTNLGNAKVPRYLFQAPKNSAINTQESQNPNPVEVNQMLELKEIEEAKQRLQGMDQFYQTQFSAPSQVQDSNIPNELQILIQESQTGLDDNEELF